MSHPICRVRRFRIIAPYTLAVSLEDHAERVIDFQPVLAGELYGPWRELSLSTK